MTTQATQRKDSEQICLEYPIADLLDEWFFRQREVSAGFYQVEGTDLWGSVVSRGGGDPDVLLVECVADAKEIIRQVKSAL